jgi:hypothetical protein
VKRWCGKRTKFLRFKNQVYSLNQASLSDEKNFQISIQRPLVMTADNFLATSKQSQAQTIPTSGLWTILQIPPPPSFGVTDSEQVLYVFLAWLSVGSIVVMAVN